MRQLVNIFLCLKTSCLAVLCMLLFASHSYAQPFNREEATKSIARYWNTLNYGKVRLVSKTIHLDSNKTVVLFGTNHSFHDPKDSMFINLEQQFRILSPSLVLTESYEPTYRTKEETATLSGEGGFCKFLAFENSIEVDSWDMHLGEIYYELTKKFDSQDVFASVFIYYLLMYQPPPGESFETFYPRFANIVERDGVPLTEDQKNPHYFFKVFYKYIGVQFNLHPSAHDQAIIDKRAHSGILKSVFTQMEVIRELHLIDMLTSQLNKHDRIFIQCGAGHVSSLESIIAKINPGNACDDKSRNSSLQKSITHLIMENKLDSPRIKGINLGDKKITIWATSAKSDFSNKTNNGYQEAAKTMYRSKKTVVLVDGFTFLKGDLELTNSWYGNAGACRFIAQQNNVPVQSWASFFSPLYFDLCRKYDKQDVFYAMLFQWLARYKNATTNYSTLAEYFDFVGGTLERERFPFTYEQTNFENFYNNSRKYFADQVISTNETTGDYLLKVESALSANPRLAPIIANMKVIRNAELMDQLEKAMNEYDEVFLQADVEYLTKSL